MVLKEDGNVRFAIHSCIFRVKTVKVLNMLRCPPKSSRLIFGSVKTILVANRCCFHMFH